VIKALFACRRGDDGWAFST